MATQVYPYLMRYPLSKLETRGLLSGVIFENGTWQKKSRPEPEQTRAKKQSRNLIIVESIVSLFCT